MLRWMGRAVPEGPSQANSVQGLRSAVHFEVLLVAFAASYSQPCCGLQFTQQLLASAILWQGFEGLTQRIAEYQAEREARAAAVRAEEEERRLRECSFAPDINRSRVQAKVRGRLVGWGGVRVEVGAKGDQAVRWLAGHQPAQQAACRLHAATSSQPSRPHPCPHIWHPITPPFCRCKLLLPQGPVVVRGLDRHLELRQLAERQRAEADARAARVFHANPRAKQGATVPQPFQLRGHALLEVRQTGKVLEAVLPRWQEMVLRPHACWPQACPQAQ